MVSMKVHLILRRMIPLIGLPILFFLAAWWVVRSYMMWWVGAWRRDPAFGAGLYYGFIMFCVLAIINGALQSAPLKLSNRMIVAGACAAVFCFIFSSGISSSPYRVGSVLMIGVIGLFLPVALVRWERWCAR
jgi:hypothetical protein